MPCNLDLCLHGVKGGVWEVNGSPFFEFSMPVNERESHFLKMMWKILALSLSSVPHLNCYLMHVSDFTGNPGYLSLVKRY